MGMRVRRQPQSTGLIDERDRFLVRERALARIRLRGSGALGGEELDVIDATRWRARRAGCCPQR
jgi:hypothetical protein